MSSLWDVPQYLVMAFSLAFPAPAEKASKVVLSQPATSHLHFVKPPAGALGEQMWLRTLKTAGSSSDILASYAARVFVTSSGRYYVPAAQDRADILAMRSSAEVATRVIAAAARATALRLEKQRGAPARPSALLVAHVAGYEAALAFSKELARDPSQRASEAVPQLSHMLGNKPSLSLAALDARLGAALDVKATHMADATTPVEDTIKGTLTAPDTAPSRALAQAH